MPAQVERTPAPVFHAKPTVFTGPKPSKAPELDGPEPPSEGRDREYVILAPSGRSYFGGGRGATPKPYGVFRMRGAYGSRENPVKPCHKHGYIRPSMPLDVPVLVTAGASAAYL